MELNYHHLMYFWTVAREGSIARASAELLVSQPTISEQIRELERSLGEKLFVRASRRLVLTDAGRIVLDHANEIFSVGRQLLDAVRLRPTDKPLRLAVGVSDALPKLAARFLIEPAFRLPQPIHLICRQDKSDRLLLELASYRLDVVFSDAPANPAVKARTFNHLLGRSSVSFFAQAPLARRLRKSFPSSLNGCKLLLPTDNTSLRRAIDQWIASRGLATQIVGEFEDTALLKTFGQAGIGVFPAPSVVAAEVARQYNVKVVARVPEIQEQFYAITVERKLKHPAVIAISSAARAKLEELG